jgi:ABC-type transport system substrate-binding protein
MRHPIFGTGVDTPVGKADPSKAAEAARNVRVAFDYAIPRELIINNLLSGYGKAGATPMLPTQAFYDSSTTARPYDLAQAKHYLELAGYSPPSIGNAGTVNIQGILNDASGTPKVNATVILSSTKDNSTYPDSLTEAAHTTTDDNGFYSFTIIPADSGAYYYYLIDTSANPATSTYLGIYSATSTTATSGLDLTMVAIIVVVILVVVAIVVVLMRRKKK